MYDQTACAQLQDRLANRYPLRSQPNRPGRVQWYKPYAWNMYSRKPVALAYHNCLRTKPDAIKNI